MTAIKPSANTTAVSKIKNSQLQVLENRVSNVFYVVFDHMSKQCGKDDRVSAAGSTMIDTLEAVNLRLPGGAQLVELNAGEIALLKATSQAVESYTTYAHDLLTAIKSANYDTGRIKEAVDVFVAMVGETVFQLTQEVNKVPVVDPDYVAPPSFGEQFETAASNLEKLQELVLRDAHIQDREAFRNNITTTTKLLRHVAHELIKQDQVIEAGGKSFNKLLAQVHELTIVRSSEEWAELMAKFSKLVERDKEVGAESAPVMTAVWGEILKAQRHIIDQETKIEELQQRRQHEVRVLSEEEPLSKRVERFKRGLQTMFNSMQSSQKNDMAVPPRGVTKAKNTLTQGCQLVQDMMDLLKVRGDKLVELTENAMKETEILSASQVECSELKAKNHDLEELVKCTESYLADAQAKIDAMAVDSGAKDEELITLRTNYAECLGRLFKARVMRPEELYSKGALFLPQVTFTPENDGFYEVNPEWHDKVVNDLKLDLHNPVDRSAYECILIASAARLHNNNYPVVDGDKQEITVVVAWDAYLSVDRKSPTFSTGKLPLFKPAEHETVVFSYQADNGWEKNDKKDVGLDDVDNQGSSEEVVVDEPKEPLLLSKVQSYIGQNLYTISEEFVIWFSKYKSRTKAGLGELYVRNDFRTYLSEKIAKFIGIGITPVVVIDWDAAAITGSLNFICLALDPYRSTMLGQLKEGVHPEHKGVKL